jgi:hypothetical protein
MVQEPLNQSSSIDNPQRSQAMSQAMGMPGEGFGTSPLDMNRQFMTPDFYKKFLRRSTVSQEASDEATAFGQLITGSGDVDKLKDHRKEVDEIVGKVKGKVIIKEYPPKRASFDTIEAHLQQLEHQNDFKPDMIIIDYLDYMRTKGRKDRKDEIDDVYVAAKAFGKERGIPIISPSQANRTAAKSDIIEGDNAAGSYDKIMVCEYGPVSYRGFVDQGCGQYGASARAGCAGRNRAMAFGDHGIYRFADPLQCQYALRRFELHFQHYYPIRYLF